MDNEQKESFKKVLWGTAGAIVVGGAAFIATRYRVAKPNELIAKTGLGIGGITLSKQTLQLPFQTAQIYEINPFSHNFDLKCMSREMIEMKLPIAFTMQPITPDKDLDGALNYARRMLNISDVNAHKTISNALEGTTRTLSGQLSIDELFHNRDAFRDKVIAGVQAELKDIGVEIVTANIQEMGDYDEKNKYFEYRKQRATESANHQAQIDVAEARMLGKIGVAQREGKIRIETALIERDAKIAENARNQSIAASNAELSVVEAEARRASEQANVEASIKVETRKIEMERELEEKRRLRQIESERATTLAPTLVLKEKIETDAQAALYKKSREADADAYSIQKLAEANKLKVEQQAEASLFEAQKQAEGVIARKNAEAEGILKIKSAEADGLKRMMEASHQNAELTVFYLGLNTGLPQKQAEESAKALQNLNPKVTIFTDKSDGGMADVFAGLPQKLIPVLQMLKDDVQLPSYLPQAK